MTEQKCKIDFVSDRYDLDEFETRYGSTDEHLLARWTGEEGVEPDGYRTLTEWFNKRLLTIVYEKHGRETMGTRIESDYEALVGDDDLLREEVMDDMRSDGIDAENLERDLVSWSTMREHLTTCLDGEKTIRESTSDWEQQSVAYAKNITRTKVRDALSSLDADDRLSGGDDAEITVQVLLQCPDCQTRIPFEDALERGYVCADHSLTEAATTGGK